MNITQEKTGELTAILHFEVESSDYRDKLSKALKSFAKKAQIKGFRPGKAPVGLIKKMYGTELLAEELNNLLHKSLYDYLGEQKLDILGNPLPLPADEEQQLDVNADKGYKFGYEIGLRPDFTIYGLEEGDHVFDSHQIQLPDEEVEKEIDNLTRRAGELGAAEGDTQEDDVLKVRFTEMGPMETPHTHETSVMINTFKDDQKEAVLGAAVGSKLKVNPFDLMDRDKASVGRHLLGLENEEALGAVSDSFEMEILEIQRLAPAERNQEFFDKVFGPGVVDSEEAFVARVKEQLEEGYKNASESRLNMTVINTIVEKTNIALPEAFLRKWMASSNSEDGEKQPISEEQFEGMRNSIKWQLIRGRLVEANELSVSEEDILERASDDMRKQLAQYMPTGFPDEEIRKYAMNMLKEGKYREETANRLLDERVIDSLRNQIATQDVEISIEAFNELAKQDQ